MHVRLLTGLPFAFARAAWEPHALTARVSSSGFKFSQLEMSKHPVPSFHPPPSFSLRRPRGFSARWSAHRSVAQIADRRRRAPHCARVHLLPQRSCSRCSSRTSSSSFRTSPLCGTSPVSASPRSAWTARSQSCPSRSPYTAPALTPPARRRPSSPNPSISAHQHPSSRRLDPPSLRNSPPARIRLPRSCPRRFSAAGRGAVRA